MRNVFLKIQGDEEVKKICNDYWSFDNENEYSKKVEDIATAYGITRSEVTKVVKESCVAEFKCNRCSKKIKVKIRSELEPLRKLDNLHRINCKECFSTVYRSNGGYGIKPVIKYDNFTRKYFFKLSEIYHYVFPSLSPAAFINKDVVNNLLISQYERDLYYSARFHFVICDGDFRPMFAVDVMSIRDWSNKSTFKKNILEQSGFKYFTLPHYEEVLITNVPKKEKNKYFIDLLNGLYDIPNINLEDYDNDVPF